MSDKNNLWVFRLVNAERHAYVKRLKGKITTYFSLDGPPSPDYRKFVHESQLEAANKRIKQLEKVIEKQLKDTEDLQDMLLYELRKNEPTVDWSKIKERMESEGKCE